MPIEITPFIPQVVKMDLSISPKAQVRLKPHVPNTINEGYNALFKINGIDYEAHEFHKREGHTPGALVKGDGAILKLDSTFPVNAINKNIFRYVPPGKG